MNSLPTIPLFPSGRFVATPGALALLQQVNKSPLEFVSRHLRGDWGDLCQEDKTENELSLNYGIRLLSDFSLWLRRFERLQAMNSSMTKDRIAFGNLSKLSYVWFEP